MREMNADHASSIPQRRGAASVCRSLAKRIADAGTFYRRYVSDGGGSQAYTLPPNLGPAVKRSRHVSIRWQRTAPKQSRTLKVAVTAGEKAYAVGH